MILDGKDRELFDKVLEAVFEVLNKNKSKAEIKWKIGSTLYWDGVEVTFSFMGTEMYHIFRYPIDYADIVYWLQIRLNQLLARI